MCAHSRAVAVIQHLASNQLRISTDDIDLMADLATSIFTHLNIAVRTTTLTSPPVFLPILIYLVSFVCMPGYQFCFVRSGGHDRAGRSTDLGEIKAIFFSLLCF
jgi:hypothetical protein